VLAAKVATRGLSNPLVDQSIATAVLPDLTVDSGFSESAMVGLARTFAHTQISNVPQFTYPVATVTSGPLLYQGYDYGDVVFPVEPNGVQAIDQIFDVSSADNSFTGAALPKTSSVKVSVENGTGVTNQAAAIANPLHNRGFDVVSTGDVASNGPISETVVWYGGPPPPTNGDWTSPSLAAAQTVLAQLEGPVILGYNPHEVTAGAQVTVQTGTGISIKPNVVASTTTTLKKTTTTGSKTTTTSPATSVTTTTEYDPPGIKGNGNFTAPSPVNPTLEPWDPRACNAAGTGPA